MRLEKLLEFTSKPPQGAIVTLPFANQEALDWLGKGYIVLGYAIQPRTTAIFQRDVFMNPPKFTGAYVIALPPWTHKNDAADKGIYDHYGTDNLYKCFVKMLLKDPALGGTIVLPLNFLIGIRDSEQTRRSQFFRLYEVRSITVFSDELIDKMIPIVIEFQRWTEYAKSQNQIKIRLVAKCSTTETFWNINHTPKNPFIMESCPFLTNYTKEAKKKITVQYNSYDKPTLYLSKTAYPPTLSAEPLENSTNITIIGQTSHRLRRRLANDFNDWLTNWLESTHGIFLPFLIINGTRKPTIPNELVAEALRRIVWSYYKPE